MSNNTLYNVNQYLTSAYEVLDFKGGALVGIEEVDIEGVVNKGAWLDLIKKVRAHKIFFVQNNPVVVFAESASANPDDLRQLYNRVWSMGRPKFLFLATKTELGVYDLEKPPVPHGQWVACRTLWKKDKALLTVETVAEIASKLKTYHREQLESGKLFEEKHFGQEGMRADKALIKDLKVVRKALMASGLGDKNLEFAHSLIGRSIFIRYLEDRKILTDSYFREIAAQNEEWQHLLNTSLASNLNPDTKDIIYPKILKNKAFTFALFKKLSLDFNGDMFPNVEAEEKVIEQKHLDLLSDFLLGTSGQHKLFLWAYKFDIISFELISSIYEEFYHTENQKDDKGTYYTPHSLVEFTLSKILTPERLAARPRVLDPACGSAIFLVEAFRRMVRYETAQKRSQNNKDYNLTNKELRRILKNQITGIEVNPAAIRIAAFSLYLALLHYQNSPDIQKQLKEGQKLPNLIFGTTKKETSQYYNILFSANAFETPPELKANSFDIIIGNPPWGSPSNTDKEGKHLVTPALQWCSRHNLPVGDKERSQIFIWKILDFLKPNGFAALLVSASIFFKKQRLSKAFRKQWLEKNTLLEVVNFTHVRSVFFKNSKGIAPFAAVFFQKSPNLNPYHLFPYWSAKNTAAAYGLQAVILSKPDLNMTNQQEIIGKDVLWKIAWWGSHHDARLIAYLSDYKSLEDYYDEPNSGRGFQKGNQKHPSAWLLNFKEFPTSQLSKYGELNLDNLQEVPPKVERRGKNRHIYEGTRLIIKRGITQKTDASQHLYSKGQIISRLENTNFCFKNSAHSIKLKSATELDYHIVLGIFWSSLARYFFFLTSSNWGIWHDEIRLNEVLELPLHIPENKEDAIELVEVVRQLRNYRDNSHLFSPKSDEQPLSIKQLETKLDEEVFKLFKLNQRQIDLINDFCEVDLEFFYNHYKSTATNKVALPAKTTGKIKDLDKKNQSLEGYLHVFLRQWNQELEPDGEFSWQVIQHQTVLCVIFSTQNKADDHYLVPENRLAWKDVLDKLQSDLLVPFDSSKIFIDGMVRVLTDTEIIIIKRNEKRLWTRSQARIDAEACLVQAINAQEINPS